MNLIVLIKTDPAISRLLMLRSGAIAVQLIAVLSVYFLLEHQIAKLPIVDKDDNIVNKFIEYADEGKCDFLWLLYSSLSETDDNIKNIMSPTMGKDDDVVNLVNEKKNERKGALTASLLTHHLFNSNKHDMKVKESHGKLQRREY